MSASRYVVIASFVGASVAGSIFHWKERCDAAALRQHLQIETVAAQASPRAGAVPNLSLAEQLDVAHDAHTTTLIALQEQ